MHNSLPSLESKESNKLKVGLLFTSFGPYHLERLKACLISKKYCVLGIELSRLDADYDWLVKIDAFESNIVSIFFDQNPSRVALQSLVWKTFNELDKRKCDLLAIAGYSHPMMLTALAWCVCFRKPAILMLDSKEDDHHRVFWKESIKALFVGFYKAALVAGSPQKRYLEKLGMPSERIFTGYDVVGNDTFAPSKIRSLPNLRHGPYFLAINRFVPKKNLPNLITAYAAYRQSAGASAWDLVLCGNGELRTQIEDQIRQLGLTKYVYLPGFLQQNELLPYFAHAGCFVHASIQEQWGLVVNEAMAAGLPVLVSRTCGCFEDLVIEGVNGFGFDPTNVDELSTLMSKMSSGDVDRKEMGDAGLEHIRNFSPTTFAANLFQAVKVCMETKV